MLGAEIASFGTKPHEFERLGKPPAVGGPINRDLFGKTGGISRYLNF